MVSSCPASGPTIALASLGLWFARNLDQLFTEQTWTDATDTQDKLSEPLLRGKSVTFPSSSIILKFIESQGLSEKA